MRGENKICCDSEKPHSAAFDLIAKRKNTTMGAAGTEDETEPGLRSVHRSLHASTFADDSDVKETPNVRPNGDPTHKHSATPSSSSPGPPKSPSLHDLSTLRSDPTMHRRLPASPLLRLPLILQYVLLLTAPIVIIGFGSTEGWIYVYNPFYVAYICGVAAHAVAANRVTLLWAIKYHAAIAVAACIAVNQWRGRDSFGGSLNLAIVFVAPAAAGFTASRAHSNIGHNPWRMTFVARHAF